VLAKIGTAVQTFGKGPRRKSQNSINLLHSSQKARAKHVLLGISELKGSPIFTEELRRNEETGHHDG
jgi:hypothetical protein